MNSAIKRPLTSWLTPILIGVGLAIATPTWGSSPLSWQSKAPLSPTQVAMESYRKAGQRWIEINLTTQRLIAWQGKKPVWAVMISTGKQATPTPTGVYAIQTRYRLARMQGDDYDIADVPYTMYFADSYAIHGAYWHNRFGTPVSHGCVNLAVDRARWLFNWVSVGTPVVVHH